MLLYQNKNVLFRPEMFPCRKKQLFVLFIYILYKNNFIWSTKSKWYVSYYSVMLYMFMFIYNSCSDFNSSYKILTRCCLQNFIARHVIKRHLYFLILFWHSPCHCCMFKSLHEHAAWTLGNPSCEITITSYCCEMGIGLSGQHHNMNLKG